ARQYKSRTQSHNALLSSFFRWYNRDNECQEHRLDPQDRLGTHCPAGYLKGISTMSSKKRIFRRVLSADPIDRRCTNLGLECGHRLEWVTLAKRKACPFCEYIAEFAQRRPADYNTLARLLHKIPMDDRANVIVEWVREIDNALVLMKRGID